MFPSSRPCHGSHQRSSSILQKVFQTSPSVGKMNDLRTARGTPSVGVSQCSASSQTPPQVVASAYQLLKVTRSAGSMLTYYMVNFTKKVIDEFIRMEASGREAFIVGLWSVQTVFVRRDHGSSTAIRVAEVLPRARS